MRYQPTAVLAAIVVACAPAFGAAMSKDEYKAEKERVKASTKVDGKACDAMTGNAKDICNQEAKGKGKVALAELEFKQSAKPADGKKLGMAKAEATYEVAKERCDDQSGAAKNACQATAKAEFAKAKTGL